jgi:hypothetical protein
VSGLRNSPLRDAFKCTSPTNIKMEQYYLPKELDFENLRKCLDNYSPTFLYIRDCGGIRENGKYDPSGMPKVIKKLKNKTLDFKKDDSGLYMLVDYKEVFHFPLKNYEKGFSLEYERIKTTKEGLEEMIMLSHGSNPYDPNLPEPRKSTLRAMLDDHLMEISFKGRINIEFHSWWDKPYSKYWNIIKPKINLNMGSL